MTKKEIPLFVPTEEELHKLALFSWPEGSEILVIGYISCHDSKDPKDNETPRQIELEDWIERVELSDVGTFIINVDEDGYFDLDEFKPHKNEDQLKDVERQLDYTQFLGVRIRMKRLFRQTVTKVSDDGFNFWFHTSRSDLRIKYILEMI